jgi:hypothetical protein
MMHLVLEKNKPHGKSVDKKTQKRTGKKLMK